MSTTLPATISELDDLHDGKPHPGRRMTEEEFEEWCDDKTFAEWIDGEVIIMSPVSDRHNLLSVFLTKLLGMFVEVKPIGELFTEPFHFRLPGKRRRRSPDLFVVATERLPKEPFNVFNGAPDFIIEIVSPKSVDRDWNEKFAEYEAAGVREYWILDPLTIQFAPFALVEGKFQRIEEREGKISSVVLPGFYVRPQWFWQERLPAVRPLLQEMGVE